MVCQTIGTDIYKRTDNNVSNSNEVVYIDIELFDNLKTVVVEKDTFEEIYTISKDEVETTILASVSFLKNAI